jgi:lipopolysaccharide transport system ATP-binding protein
MGKNTIIKVEGLGKKYLLNKNVMQKSDTLYGSFINGLKNAKKLTQKKQTEEFWALKDVSFEIEQGDRVGIIGRNGAGKSTLLKILSRITPPTKGRIEYSGRMASLLEVGTGFHGDLSGRENIYLNGSILGMTKHEIDRKFDEIVAFSEIEKFIDTPVKRYSSGMYVRLAFAVAAHLEPEILIVDEVLAVGDAAFQKKCIGKMDDVSKSGKTILFVSHNIGHLSSLCNKAIVLKKGSVFYDGNIEEGVANYNDENKVIKSEEVSFQKNSNDGISIENIDINVVDNKLVINLSIFSSEIFFNANIGYGIGNVNSKRILTLMSKFSSESFTINKGINVFTCEVDNFNLKPGEYTTDIYIGTTNATLLHFQQPILFQIDFFKFYETGNFPDESQGDVLVKQKWFKKQ